jgi:glycosyltransferase involved in cell wall biosynthesis
VHGAPRHPHPPRGPHPRPLRAALFTDTLADINGVARFVRNLADESLAQGKDLTIFTSTRLPFPARSNIINLPPRYARPMPRYEHLQLAIPPFARTLSLARNLRPDIIHVSTPGPVGLAGLIAARILRVPLVGVYHTDFPAYIEHLFNDDSLAFFARLAMRAFYAPFAALFTRSEDTRAPLTALGIAPSRILPLAPGIITADFHPRFRSEPLAHALGMQPGALRLLYTGRVSIEKNLPLLSTLWQRVHPLLAAQGINAQLIIVGDGPYRAAMQRELAHTPALFLGFRHAEELAAIYASSDLFIFPSNTDTLGQVVMEAQSSGLPVLVSSRGGPRHIVHHAHSGFVLPADNLPAWQAALMSLCTDPARRARMSAHAHESMRPFDMRSSFDHFWSVHETIAHKSL